MKPENIQEPVVIAEFNLDAFAKMLVEILENEGIPAWVHDGDSALQFTFGSTALGDGGLGAVYQVCVDRPYLETAMAKIEELREHQHEIFADSAENLTEDELEYPDIDDIDEDNWEKLVEVDADLMADVLCDALLEADLDAQVAKITKANGEISFGVFVPKEEAEEARGILDKLEKNEG